MYKKEKTKEKEIIKEKKKNHIKRVKKEKIHIKRGFVYAEILNDLERISDHCSNIATNIIQSVNSSIPKHVLKNKLKDSNNEDFAKTVETFRENYAVEPLSIQVSSPIKVSSFITTAFVKSKPAFSDLVDFLKI